MEAFLEAKRQGVIRYIGFTAHSPQAALAAMREFDFDTIMYPINFVCHFADGFEVEVLAEANRRHMGIICIKSLARHRWQDGADRTAYPNCWYEPIDDPELARLALGWSLARGVTTLIPPGDPKLSRLAISLAGVARAPGDAELDRLKQVALTTEPIFRS